MIETLEKLCTLVEENKKNIKENDYIKIMEHLKSLYDNKVINLMIIDDERCAGFDCIEETSCYYNGNIMNDDEEYIYGV